MNTSAKVKAAQAIFVLIIIVSIIAGIYYGVRGSVFKNIAASRGSEVAISIEPQNKARFFTFGKEFAEVNKSGVKFYDMDGKIKWTNSYLVQSLMAVCEEQIFAIYEPMGKILKVYNSSGMMYEVFTNDPIAKVSLNQNGYCAVVLSGKNSSRVQVYDNSGAISLERIDEDLNIFPVHADISADNSLVSIAYVDTSGIDLLSKVLVFKIEDVGITQADINMYATQNFNEEFVSIVKFVDKQHLIVITDTKAAKINISEQKSQSNADLIVWSIDFNNEVHQVCFNPDGTFAISYSNPFPGKPENDFGSIVFYSLNGDIVNKFEYGEISNYMVSSSDTTVAGFGRNFFGFNKKGDIVFEYTSIEDIEELIPFSNKNLAMKVSIDKAAIINITEKVPALSDINDEPEPAEQNAVTTISEGIEETTELNED